MKTFIYNRHEKGMYNTLPKSMKSQLLVKSIVEDQEVSKTNAEAVKARSVHELSQIHGLDDIPLPAAIDSFVGRTGSRPVERRKKFREK